MISWDPYLYQELAAHFHLASTSAVGPGVDGADGICPWKEYFMIAQHI